MIRLILRLLFGIWRWFWRLLRIASLLAFLGMAILFYQGYKSGQAGVEQALQSTVHQVRKWIGQPTSSPSIDQHQDLEDGTRWETNRANVYISTQDKTFRQAYSQAIANWNATGAFEFVLVENREQADIIASDMNDGSVSAAGVTESESNMLTHRLNKATVKLNHFYLSDPAYGYGLDRIVHTAEHELGHAIGLNHNEGVSVMQSAGSFLTIQPEDVSNVRALYGI